MRFAVIGDVQFVEQVTDDSFRHGMFAVAILLQQLCVGHFEVVQVHAGVVVGEKPRPFVADIAADVGSRAPVLSPAG